MVENSGSTQAQFQQEAASIKGIIFDMINGDNLDMAKQILEQYTLLNPTDPDIKTIKSMLYPEGLSETEKDSEIQEERNWANGAMMRANRTASSFNNFILENSFVWAYGVPNDINIQLETLRNE